MATFKFKVFIDLEQFEVRRNSSCQHHWFLLIPLAQVWSPPPSPVLRQLSLSRSLGTGVRHWSPDNSRQALSSLPFCHACQLTFIYCFFYLWSTYSAFKVISLVSVFTISSFPPILFWIVRFFWLPIYGVTAFLHWPLRYQNVLSILYMSEIWIKHM